MLYIMIKDPNMICKTEAKKQYILNDDDLEDIVPQITRHSKYKTQIYMYNKDELFAKAIEKYGSVEEFNIKKNKKIERLIKSQETSRQKKNNKLLLEKTRRNELEQMLAEYNLQIREDSLICNEYIKLGDKAMYDKHEIVLIMNEMNFLYNHTNYKNILKTVRHNNYDSYYDSENDNEANEEDIREKAKEMACKKYLQNNGSIDKMPFSLEQKYGLYNNIKK